MKKSKVHPDPKKSIISVINGDLIPNILSLLERHTSICFESIKRSAFGNYLEDLLLLIFLKFGFTCSSFYGQLPRLNECETITLVRVAKHVVAAL